MKNLHEGVQKYLNKTTCTACLYINITVAAFCPWFLFIPFVEHHDVTWAQRGEARKEKHHEQFLIDSIQL